MLINGFECCYNCGDEFYFVINPKQDVFVTCPHCGTIQHACSLCDNPTDCSGRKCKETILKSLEMEG